MEPLKQTTTEIITVNMQVKTAAALTLGRLCARSLGEHLPALTSGLVPSYTNLYLNLIALRYESNDFSSNLFLCKSCSEENCTYVFALNREVFLLAQVDQGQLSMILPPLIQLAIVNSNDGAFKVSFIIVQISNVFSLLNRHTKEKIFLLTP
jgi:hypothetical protein